jgi:metal-responsive CopG/Arc/MetJ family transcriptional regulator
MSIEGFTEYKRREFCKDTKCPVQETLNNLEDKSDVYELIRQTCQTSCRYTTWQFHHWLIKKGYIILVNSQLNNNQTTILANVDKTLAEWMDHQIKVGNFSNKSQLIEKALVKYKKDQKATGLT